MKRLLAIMGRRSAERRGTRGRRSDGCREIICVAGGVKEDLERWRGFLRYLKGRGLKGVRLFISDKCLKLVEALGGFYPEAQWQPPSAVEKCRADEKLGEIFPQA
jgi:hypothetical protein